MDPVNADPFSQRPDNSAFKQQRLPAWTPMLSARTVLPVLYFTALICLFLGVWLTLTVHTVQEIKVKPQKVSGNLKGRTHPTPPGAKVRRAGA